MSCPPVEKTTEVSKSPRAKRRSPCGKLVCCFSSYFPDECTACPGSPNHAGKALCSACYVGIRTSNDGGIWEHTPNPAELVQAQRMVKELLWPLDEDVKPGFMPLENMGFFSRASWFYSNFRTWCLHVERKQQVVCAICEKKHEG